MTNTWKTGDWLERDGKVYEITRITPAGSAGRSHLDGPTYHATIVVDGKVRRGGHTVDIWAGSLSNPISAFSEAEPDTDYDMEAIAQAYGEAALDIDDGYYLHGSGEHSLDDSYIDYLNN